ncbi:MAG: hypothetical protein IRZ28_17030 [Steroidobacteraceae bacterium]|nr:hypothetical protein [Steroidobacteraceae bacterium]
MRRYVTRLILMCLSLLTHAHAAEVPIPDELQEWRGWVLQDEHYRECPFIATASEPRREDARCAWPGRLSLALDARGGTFTQTWQIFADEWVRIPGSTEHWPQSVQANGKAAAVVARNGAPHLLLTPGTYTVSGRLSWDTRPESLAIDARTGIVDLTLDGRKVAQPERPNGAVWLGKRRSAEHPARMEVQVYRLLQDGVPATLITRMRLQVSGEGREETLARVLPEGFTPLSLRSELPARLEPDGRLRVQVRAGSWELDLAARAAGVVSRVRRPPLGEGLWARDEVWSFASDDRLRVAAAQGPEGIDPAQANVPDEWRGFPAFRMTPDSILEVSERSRGLENAEENRLTLWRELWLDFSHTGFTAQDRVRGTLRKDWRLDMKPPFTLDSARIANDPLLVTRSPSGEGVGVEVRTPELDLQAVARTGGTRTALPATGWNTRFDEVSGVLHLPPGHRLLAALGADSAPDAWIERWRLWGLFGVLVVAVFAGWLAGRLVGGIALAGLLLTYQESPQYIWLWGNLLAALAVARAAPEGRLRRFARGYRAVSFAVLGVALLPLLWGQARLALHPQLDTLGPRVDYLPTPAAASFGQARPAPPPAPAERAASGFDERGAAARQPQSAPVAREPGPYGLNVQQVVQRYAPGTLVQTGSGIPDWRYIDYAYGWSGPVEAEQTVRFIYIGPLLLGVWRFAGIGLLTLLFVALATSRNGGTWRWPDTRTAIAAFLAGRSAEHTPAASANTSASIAAVTLLLMPLIPGGVPTAHAAPDKALLNELKTRLTRHPECVPSCADIMAAEVTVRGDRLDVRLEVSALANVALRVPSAGDRWQLDTVTVDDRSSLVAREKDGTLAVPLTPGAHIVRLAGALATAQSVQLDFPHPPRAVRVSSAGWEVAGLNEGRLLSGSLELIRREGQTPSGGALETASEFPPFVRVDRRFTLGLDWGIHTTVTRVAPERAAFAVEVPLLAGESVLSDTLRTRDVPQGGGRVALVGLERGQNAVAWSSGLARSETVELQMPANAERTEVWRFVVSPQWNITFEGLPAVLPASIDPANWVYEFHPRPGETLHARITRPERAEGSTLAIDSVRQTVSVGKRSSSTSLSLAYRSTQGGRHAITLPPTARVTSVRLNGQPVPLRPDDGELWVSLVPGMNSLDVDWETPSGVSLRTRPDAVNLHATASNVHTQIRLPADRWALFAFGPGVGPAVLYWSELVVFVITAFLLGRWRRSPLRTHEWLLLGLGLSTLSWAVLVLVAVWLFAMRWRQHWSGEASRWRFNTVQVALALLTVLAVGVVVFAGIRQSLLASPDMGVRGAGSHGLSFGWFVDRAEPALPQPVVFSVPLWVYRALMFAWALWLVLALLRWLRVAWHAWRTHGIWRARTAAPPDGQPESA